MNEYYRIRLNKALKYIDSNLSEGIGIADLASESGFSLYHFQRIYKSVLKETPYETLLRLRLEKSAFLLKYRPNMRIGNIAFEVGFPSVENFSRQFKSRFGYSPSSFKSDKTLQNSRIYQEEHPNDFYHYMDEHERTKSNFEVTIEQMPNIEIAFVRAIFGSDGSELLAKYHELMSWVEKHNIPFQGKMKRFGMSIDNPDVTPTSKYRYDFAITINHDYPLDNSIELSQIPGGSYATIHCIGKLEDVAKAWDHLYKTWLPNSKYVPVHSPAIEEFVQGPEEIGWQDFNLKCRIPITQIK